MTARPLAYLLPALLLSGCGESQPAKPRQEIVVRSAEEDR